MRSRPRAACQDRFPVIRRFTLLLLGLGAPLWAGAQIPLFNTDPRGPVPQEVETFNEEGIALPPAPKDRDLLRFAPGMPTSMRFYVDSASISVGKDDVVRYTLVIAGDGDTRNVMYEGLRCNVGEHKVYAYGQADGTWSPARDPQWNRLGRDIPRQTLASDFLCPLRWRIDTPAEGVEALERGIHPRVEMMRPN